MYKKLSRVTRCSTHTSKTVMWKHTDLKSQETSPDSSSACVIWPVCLQSPFKIPHGNFTSLQLVFQNGSSQSLQLSPPSPLHNVILRPVPVEIPVRINFLSKIVWGTVKSFDLQDGNSFELSVHRFCIFVLLGLEHRALCRQASALSCIPIPCNFDSV